MPRTTKVLVIFGWPILPVDRLDPRSSLLVCKHALLVWETGAYDKLLISGGRFMISLIQTRPWSEIAADWLARHGIPRDCLILETKSFDTYGNLRYSLEALRDAGIHSFELSICTYWVHGIRIRHTAKAAHGLTVQIQPVWMPLTWRERLTQWLFVIYHYIDRDGRLYAKRRRIRERKRLGLPSPPPNEA
ncbi:MAG TPA: YdcF family protein [Patescibacteria group bacterium]|nr:YdcF family protein [Patescibacteria group bacterium]